MMYTVHTTITNYKFDFTYALYFRKFGDFVLCKYGKLETPAIISNENPVRVQHYTKKSSGYTLEDQELDIVPTDILRNLEQPTVECKGTRIYCIFDI